jgi:hypothetical protein
VREGCQNELRSRRVLIQHAAPLANSHANPRSVVDRTLKIRMGPAKTIACVKEDISLRTVAHVLAQLRLPLSTTGKAKSTHPPQARTGRGIRSLEGAVWVVAGRADRGSEAGEFGGGVQRVRNMVREIVAGHCIIDAVAAVADVAVKFPFRFPSS